MVSDLWVGKLNDIGLVVYDPLIQNDETGDILLFNVAEVKMSIYNRNASRGKISKVNDKNVISECINSYENWETTTAVPKKGSEHISNIRSLETSKVKSITGSDKKWKDIVSSMERVLETREKEVKKLNTEIDSIETSKIKSITESDKKWKDIVSSMERVLETREKEVKKLKTEIASIEKQLQMKNRTIVDVEDQIVNLKKEIEESSTIEDLEELSKQAAFYASGGHESFRDLILPLKLDSDLPLRIASRLEINLRMKLDKQDPTLSLFELLIMSKDKEILDEDSSHMAHIIRKQRNAIAHVKTTKEEASSRILLSLYSASILWPKLQIIKD